MTQPKRAQKQTCLNVHPDEWPVFVALMRKRGLSASKAVQKYVSGVVRQEMQRVKSAR